MWANAWNGIRHRYDRHLPRLYPCGPTHHRNDTPYEYTTSRPNNLPGRKGSCGRVTAGVSFPQAAVIDNIVPHCLRAVIEDKRYPELAFRACPWHQNLEKKSCRNRLLVSGLPRSRLYGRYPLSISDMVDIPRGVRGGADYLPGAEADDREPHRPAHCNIRGKSILCRQRQDNQLKTQQRKKWKVNDKTSL